MDHIVQKSYLNHSGVDLKNSDLTRAPQFASGIKNAQYQTTTGSIEKRKGYQAHCASFGGYGEFTYSRVDPVTGSDTSCVVGIDQNLYVIQKAAVTVTYTGSNTQATVTIFYDTVTTQYRCQLVEGQNTVLDFAMGKGFDEASTKVLNDLVTAINAVTNFTAAISGAGSTPCAFLKIVRAWDLSSTGAPYVAEARSYLQVNTTVTNPLSTYLSKRANSDFENVSAVNINNVIYFANGYDYTMKYDGQTFYRAGLPTPASITSAIGAAGAVTGTNLYHRIQYRQFDAAGGIIEGNYLTVSAGLAPTNQQMTVTAANIQAGSGFNTNCGIVNGTQASITTINVNDGAAGQHTLKAGDTAYFKDQISGQYQTRQVTATTASSITIAGAAVTVNSGQVISNNLRIEIWRSKTSGATPTIFYLVDELPNNSFAATQAYTDNTTDANLGALQFPPLSDRSPPPKAKYISQWNGVCMMAGDPLNPNTLYSSQDGPEYFPAGSNQWLIDTAAGDRITGIGQNNQVFGILKDRAFAVASGDIGSGLLRIEVICQDIGCAAHATVMEINGTLCWLSDKGPRYSAGGQMPRPLGEAMDPDGEPTGASRIDPTFNNAGRLAGYALQFKRAVALNDRVGQKYIIFVPAETVAGGTPYANSNSQTFAYDYIQDAWLTWTNLNMAGGATVLGSEIYFQERSYSSYLTAVTFKLYRRHNLEDAWDYEDNVVPIGGLNDPYAWEYSMQWEALGEPDLLKRFIELKAWCLETIANNNFTFSVNQEINYQRDVTVGTFALSIPGAGYGNSAYGVDPYGDPAQSSVKHDLYRGRMTATRLRFSDATDQQNVIMSGWSMECALPFRPGMKR